MPVPYKNCGAPGDILHLTSLDASVWPPPIAAPLAGTATIDPRTGQVTNLRVLLAYGVNWVLDSGSLGTSLGSGFVPLPASIPMSVSSPSFPLAAGPYSTSQTFRPGTGGPAFTIQSKGNLGQSIPAAVTQLSLKYNGVSGFPVPPLPGSYEAQVHMALPSGTEVFCVDINLTDVAFVTTAPLPVPTLPRQRLLVLFLFVAATGLLALRSRGMSRSGREI